MPIPALAPVLRDLEAGEGEGEATVAGALEEVPIAEAGEVGGTEVGDGDVVGSRAEVVGGEDAGRVADADVDFDVNADEVDVGATFRDGREM
jgi:hypothetical protein